MAADSKEVGGKFANLARLHEAGVRVPKGFAVTTSAYRRFVSQIGRRVGSILARVDRGDMASAARGAKEIGLLIRRTPMQAEIAQSIRAAYEELAIGPGEGKASVPVAVRSSATAEDLPTASLAGQHETFLWVTGAEEVVKDVKECWASAYSARSMGYKRIKGLGASQVEMGVVVQEMVKSARSGVMFTVNPANGDPSKIAIDSSWGFGEATVSGLVTPDLYMVDKVTLEILERRIARKHTEFALLDGKVRQRQVPSERRRAPTLSDGEVTELAKVGKSIEKLFGRPQDIEWAMDTKREPSSIFILQARPETTWIRKAGQKAASKTALDMVVDTLRRGRKLG